MENGVSGERAGGDGSKASTSRAWARDVLGAIALAEGAVAHRILYATGVPEGAVAKHNAFGDPVKVSVGDAALQAEQCHVHAGQGERVTLVARASSLVGARSVMRRIARDRLGVVFHALDERGTAEAFALGDLGWGVVLASSVENSLDLSLIARRAAEDCGTPFLVIHEQTAARLVEPLATPDVSLCEVFVGAPQSRLRRLTDPAHPVHAKISARAFAERVPFALGSAMRELESLSSRRHDLIERSVGNDAAAMFVAAGALGESLLGEVERLRAAGHDVGAVKLTAIRPFPGPRLVRALARALAITVLEGCDEPLAQSNFLTREVKASFADALTWAPGYPGVGRIPRITSGVVGQGSHQLDALDLDAVVRNMLEGEGGKRFFVLGGEGELGLPAVHSEPQQAQASFAMRGILRDRPTAEACADLCSTVIASALALRVQATVRAAPAGGEGAVLDLVASRERPRGVHTQSSLRVVALDDFAVLLHESPLARLARGGVVAVPTRDRTPEALWSSMPPYVKAVVFDRHLRVLGWPAPDASSPPEDTRWLTAAAFVGIALAALGKRSDGPVSSPGAVGRLAVDGSLVAREVSEALAALAPAPGVGSAHVAGVGGEVARRAFESNLEVSRATIERDEDAIRLGRQDERAGAR